MKVSNMSKRWQLKNEAAKQETGIPLSDSSLDIVQTCMKYVVKIIQWMIQIFIYFTLYDSGKYYNIKGTIFLLYRNHTKFAPCN